MKRLDVQQIKKEKRARQVEAASAGVTRRRFLTFLGAGVAAMSAGSAGFLISCEGEKSRISLASRGDEELGLFFEPIAATDADELVLPEGFKYDIVRKWGDTVAPGLPYGYNNDFTAYLPIDVLEGGNDSEDGILWVNHEYVDGKWLLEDAGSGSDSRKEQIKKEKAAVGGSVFRVCKEGDSWKFAEDARYNRRIDATTPIDLTGPAAGAREVLGVREVIGTLANCGGGVTPWKTVLTCEENFQMFYGEKTVEDFSADDEANANAAWLDDPDTAQPPEHYGWVVEVDPFDKESKPRKHTWLGRLAHENVALRVAESGKVVAYTGHDSPNECIYKFVSFGSYDPNDRESNMALLTDGMLYVADFTNGRWNALDYEGSQIFRSNGFKSQADVLVRAPEAAKLSEKEGGDPLGSPLDRCEDIEVHPKTGEVYASLTNNVDGGNFYGQVIKLTEAGDDPEAMEFSFEVFAAGGPQTGFASPDNLAFDGDDNLWVVTDISSSSLNGGTYETFKNNGAFVMPAGKGRDVYQFASGPVQAELTGPSFTPDGKTLFLSVQHPGEESESVHQPTSRWPDGDIPRPAIVAITGF